MNIFPLKRQSVKAQELRDAIAAKKAAAEAKLAEAVAELERLNLQSELPDGEGIVVTPAMLGEARKARDAAGDEVERLTSALAEAERRLEEARRSDAAKDVEETWTRVERTKREAEALHAEFHDMARKLADLGGQYLQKVQALTEQSPAFAERFQLEKRTFVLRASLDRMLGLVRYVASAFHPDYVLTPATGRPAEVDKMVEEERRTLRRLGERVLDEQEPTKAA